MNGKEYNFFTGVGTIAAWCTINLRIKKMLFNFYHLVEKIIFVETDCMNVNLLAWLFDMLFLQNLWKKSCFPCYRKEKSFKNE